MVDVTLQKNATSNYSVVSKYHIAHIEENGHGHRECDFLRVVHHVIFNALLCFIDRTDFCRYKHTIPLRKIYN